MPERVCQHCSEIFVANRKDQKYCKKKCRDRASAKRTGADKRSNKKRWRKVKYGIENWEWETLKENGCFICGSLDNLVVDHDHITKKVCGCLCHSCNTGLGFFKENPDLLYSAIHYLKTTQKTPKE